MDKFHSWIAFSNYGPPFSQISAHTPRSQRAFSVTPRTDSAHIGAFTISSPHTSWYTKTPWYNKEIYTPHTQISKGLLAERTTECCLAPWENTASWNPTSRLAKNYMMPPRYTTWPHMATHPAYQYIEAHNKGHPLPSPIHHLYGTSPKLVGGQQQRVQTNLPI